MINAALALILWPLLSGFVLFAFGKKTHAAQVANIIFNLIWVYFLVGGYALSNSPEYKSQAFPVVFSWNWLPMLKSHFSLAIDGISLPLIALNIFLSVLLAFYALGKEKLGSAYLALFSILNAASVGSLLAADILAFYIFWEFMLIPMYFLIGKWGSNNRVYAALKFFAFTMVGSLPLLFAILSLSSQANLSGLGWAELVALKMPFDGWHSMQGVMFLCFLAAFAVKIPIWPVHVWLPDAHTEAPTGASVILAGILLKLGVYGIARWCLPLFPQAALAASRVMMALGCAGIVLGSFAAWQQTDIKRIIAYSSVAHLGFMVIGLFALRVESVQGALFQNIAHGLSTGALFLIFGIIYDRTHTRKLADYGGLASKEAFIASAFVFASLASIGLPGLPGFVGEFLVLTGSFMTAPVVALVAMSGVLLGAIYMLTLVRKMIFGPVSPTVAQHPINLKWSEWVSIIPLIVAMIVLGLCPQLFLTASGATAALSTMGLR